MLIRKMQDLNLYEEDTTQGTQQAPKPTPDTSQDKNEDKGEEAKLTLTQRELNRMTTKEAKDARAKAESELLAKLGVMNVDEAISKLTAIREKEESEKTEAQKLQDMIAQLTQERDAEKQRVAKIETERRIEKRDNELKSLLTQATDPNEVLALLKVFHAEKVEALLDANGVFDKAAAETLIADYRKDKGHLFRDNRLGSALSHKDGRNPEPNKETKEAAKTQTFRNMRNNA